MSALDRKRQTDGRNVVSSQSTWVPFSQRNWMVEDRDTPDPVLGGCKEFVVRGCELQKTVDIAESTLFRYLEVARKSGSGHLSLRIFHKGGHHRWTLTTQLPMVGRQWGPPYRDSITSRVKRGSRRKTGVKKSASTTSYGPSLASPLSKTKLT